MKLSRRQLMGAASAATLFPWLSARAQNAPVRKLVLFYTPHGTIWDQWRPSGGAGTTFGSSTILAPLIAPLASGAANPLRERLVIVEGLSVPHGVAVDVSHTFTMPVLWTGSPIDTASSLFTRSDYNVSFGWGKGTSGGSNDRPAPESTDAVQHWSWARSAEGLDRSPG